MPLKINRHIISQGWMRKEETRKIFTILQGNAPDEEPQALFVGGCVRDSLLGQEIRDIDIATRLTPDEVTTKLQNSGVTVIPTGLAHGTVSAVINKCSYEITTLRRDEQTDGRHAIVSYTQSWKEDAMRRDFTLNALFLDCLGNVYDPLGQGLDDLDARQVRFVGNPTKRVEEDYLRILRFFRFTALYAKNEYDEAGLKACRTAADKVQTLSKERISQEFFKIMMADKPYETLSIMFDHGVLKSFDFDSYNSEFLEYVGNFQIRYNLTALPTRLLVVAGMSFDNIKTMEEFVIFPKIFIKDMKCILGSLALPDLSSDPCVRSSVYSFGRSATAQALMVELAQDRVTNAYAGQAISIIQNWDIPNLPIGGSDLMDAGIKKGPELGIAIRTLEKWWIDQDFKPDRVECLKKIIV